jgi:hypothetical protein
VKLKVKHCAGSDKNSRQTTTPVYRQVTNYRGIVSYCATSTCRSNGVGDRSDSTGSEAAGGTAWVPALPWASALLAQWEEASTHGISGASAAHLMGTSGFLLETACARVGRAALLPLVDRQNHSGPTTFTPAMQRSHAFFRALLDGAKPRLPPLRIPIVADTTPRFLSTPWRKPSCQPSK